MTHEQAGTMASLSPDGRGLVALRDFVMAFGSMLERNRDERLILFAGAPLLQVLVAKDDWLPEEYARPAADGYRQYLLHCDSRERFSIVSFVWGPGQSTPVHDHCVWGLIGMLRGGELSQRYVRVGHSLVPRGEPSHLIPGAVETLSPREGDVHQVSSAGDRVSVSIHVYGANIGRVRRSAFDDQGVGRLFVSGYDNAFLPNFWGSDK